MSFPLFHDLKDPAPFLRSLYDAAVARAQPGLCLPPHLPPLPEIGRLIVLGAGKAASAMAETVEAHYGPDAPLTGLVITRYGHARKTRRIETREAAHPVPDQAGLEAAADLIRLAEAATPDDLVLVLLSGGGSALLPAPVEGITLAEKQRLTKALLASGASIADINTVRKHLSRVKGGGLAEKLRARTLTLAISDVAGDDPAIIASGPTVPDPTTLEDARRILGKHALLTPEIETALARAGETPKPGDPCFKNKDYRLIARPRDALAAAAKIAEEAGITVTLLGEALEGEARDLARTHAALARAYEGETPHLFLSGGEAAVTFEPGTATGEGGPNQEYALAFALALEGAPNIYALAGDTDGNDGGKGRADDPAGAFVTPDTCAKAAAAGLSPEAALAAHDSGGFFRAIGGLITPGPTFTNVNDFRAILVLPRGPHS